MGAEAKTEESIIAGKGNSVPAFLIPRKDHVGKSTPDEVARDSTRRKHLITTSPDNPF
jgi:hypothetical protein